MASIRPTPPESAIEKIQEQWKERSDSSGRIYSAVLGVNRLTHYKKIAEIADCSPPTAEKHLLRFVDMGLVTGNNGPHSTLFKRNEAYFEWYEASHVAEKYSEEEIIEEVRKLESQKNEYEERLGERDTRTFNMFDHPTHDTAHEYLESTRELMSLRQDIELYKLAYWIRSNDGYLLPR